MKFSENWLREWVNPDIDSETLSEQLTMLGLEVEQRIAAASDFSGVVIGRIAKCDQHPNADKLRVTKVDIGASRMLDIVCGAENCRQGLMVACATVGAKLPGNVKITRTKLRGETSEGMLCAYAELGIPNEQEKGIIELPDDAPLGENLRNYLQLDDRIFDINVTPNRADCFSLIGIARDIGAANYSDVKKPCLSKQAILTDDHTKVNLLESGAIPKYLSRVIRDIDPKTKTPVWMKEKLRRSGIRSIDAVVDVTNYVMVELGQPMHAYDFDKIVGDITVRYGKPHEKLTLLDGKEVSVKATTLVIADEKKVLALAGIMGGLSSAVSNDTNTILFEAAFITSNAVVGKAREYGLHTDASHRFERGVDSELTHMAMERATELLIAICGGKAGHIVETRCDKMLPKPAIIELHLEKVNQLIGCLFDEKNVIAILTRLGCQVKSLANVLQITPPSWRFDLQIEEDLVEEVARIHGYNTIPNEPLKADLATHLPQQTTQSLSRAKALFVDRGFQEAITYSFVDPKIQVRLHPDQPALMLPNPISQEMSAMRVSLWTGLLDALVYNQHRQQHRVRLFESGLRFIPDDNAEFSVRQEPVISGLVSGNVYEEHWNLQKNNVDFFDLKGDIEALLAVMNNHATIEFRSVQHPALHPGQSAAIYSNGDSIGIMGTLHPQLQKELAIKGNVIVFELLWDKLISSGVTKFKDVSRFPANRRDIAIIVDTHIPSADIIAECNKVGGDNLISVNLFDVYQGNNIDAGKKSLAISLILQNNSRTLEESDIINIVDNCIEALQNRFDALLRE